MLHTVGEIVDMGGDVGDVVQIGDVTDEPIVVINGGDGNAKDFLSGGGEFGEGSSPGVVRTHLSEDSIELQPFFKEVFSDMASVQGMLVTQFEGKKTGIGVLDDPFFVGVKDRVSCVFEGGGTFMELIESLLGQRDILGHAENIFAVIIQTAVSPFAENFIVSAGNVVIFGVAYPFFGGFLEDGEDMVAIKIGDDQIEDTLSQRFFFVPSEDSFGALIPFDNRMAGIDNDEGDGRIAEKLRIPVLAFDETAI